MSKLWLIGLAVSAAWTPAAMAQGAPPPPPPPPMAHGAHAPGHGGGMVMHGGGGHVMPPGMGGGMKGFHRFGRGHIVPPHFRNRQFFVNNWQMFGWPAPMPGGQWIRVYDDALLIDRDGRVMDGRYGWDWDGRGDRMAYDEGYEDDYAYGEDDYDREDWDDDGPDGRDHREMRVYRHDGDGEGDCRQSCTRVRHMPPPPHPGYGYGYGYGYGSGCGCGPVVVTETITTTAPVVETRTYYETVYEHRAAPRRHYRQPVVRHYVKPAVRRSVKAAPAPRPGERG
jgi:Nickel/cobalt transporter regulator